MLNRWVIDGSWNNSSWNDIISPGEEWPHPQGEITSGINTTSTVVALRDGSQARVSRAVKFRKPSISFTISVFRTREIKTYVVPSTPVQMTVKEIIEEIIKNDISVRIRYQEYENSTWVTEETFAGYFSGIGKTYKLLKFPQQYVCDITLDRFNVDGTGVY